MLTNTTVESLAKALTANEQGFEGAVARLLQELRTNSAALRDAVQVIAVGGEDDEDTQ